MCPSLVRAGASGGDDPADFSADGAGDCDFARIRIPEDLISGFAMAVGPADEGRAIKDVLDVFEIDQVSLKIALAPALVPPEGANTSKQIDDVVVGHGGAPPRLRG
jgi:hypothetical protein